MPAMHFNPETGRMEFPKPVQDLIDKRRPTPSNTSSSSSSSSSSGGNNSSGGGGGGGRGRSSSSSSGSSRSSSSSSTSNQPSKSQQILQNRLESFREIHQGLKEGDKAAVQSGIAGISGAPVDPYKTYSSVDDPEASTRQYNPLETHLNETMPGIGDVFHQQRMEKDAIEDTQEWAQSQTTSNPITTNNLYVEWEDDQGNTGSFVTTKGLRQNLLNELEEKNKRITLVQDYGKNKTFYEAPSSSAIQSEFQNQWREVSPIDKPSNIRMSDEQWRNFESQYRAGNVSEKEFIQQSSLRQKPDYYRFVPDQTYANLMYQYTKGRLSEEDLQKSLQRINTKGMDQDPEAAAQWGMQHLNFGTESQPKDFYQLQHAEPAVVGVKYNPDKPRDERFSIDYDYKKAKHEHIAQLGQVGPEVDIFGTKVRPIGLMGQASKIVLDTATQFPVAATTGAGYLYRQATGVPQESYIDQFANEVNQRSYNISQAARAGHEGRGWGSYINKTVGLESPFTTDILLPAATAGAIRLATPIVGAALEGGAIAGAASTVASGASSLGTRVAAQAPRLARWGSRLGKTALYGGLTAPITIPTIQTGIQEYAGQVRPGSTAEALTRTGMQIGSGILGYQAVGNYLAQPSSRFDPYQALERDISREAALRDSVGNFRYGVADRLDDLGYYYHKQFPRMPHLRQAVSDFKFSGQQASMGSDWGLSTPSALQRARQTFGRKLYSGTQRIKSGVRNFTDLSKVPQSIDDLGYGGQIRPRYNAQGKLIKGDVARWDRHIGIDRTGNRMTSGPTTMNRQYDPWGGYTTDSDYIMSGWDPYRSMHDMRHFAYRHGKPPQVTIKNVQAISGETGNPMVGRSDLIASMKGQPDQRFRMFYEVGEKIDDMIPARYQIHRIQKPQSGQYKGYAVEGEVGVPTDGRAGQMYIRQTITEPRTLLKPYGKESLTSNLLDDYGNIIPSKRIDAKVWARSDSLDDATRPLFYEGKSAAIQRDLAGANYEFEGIGRVVSPTKAASVEYLDDVWRAKTGRPLTKIQHSVNNPNVYITKKYIPDILATPKGTTVRSSGWFTRHLGEASDDLVSTQGTKGFTKALLSPDEQVSSMTDDAGISLAKVKLKTETPLTPAQQVAPSVQDTFASEVKTMMQQQYAPQASVVTHASTRGATPMPQSWKGVYDTPYNPNAWMSDPVSGQLVTQVAKPRLASVFPRPPGLKSTSGWALLGRTNLPPAPYQAIVPATGILSGSITQQAISQAQQQQNALASQSALQSATQSMNKRALGLASANLAAQRSSTASAQASQQAQEQAQEQAQQQLQEQLQDQISDTVTTPVYVPVTTPVTATTGGTLYPPYIPPVETGYPGYDPYTPRPQTPIPIPYVPIPGDDNKKRKTVTYDSQIRKGYRYKKHDAPSIWGAVQQRKIGGSPKFIKPSFIKL